MAIHRKSDELPFLRINSRFLLKKGPLHLEQIEAKSTRPLIVKVALSVDTDMDEACALVEDDRRVVRAHMQT